MARREIMSGLLNYRDALRRAGLFRGYQWLDGSFIENIETIEGREPGDVDVVTFFHLPDGQTQESCFGGEPRLSLPEVIKKEYRVDAYYVQLNTAMPELLIDLATYWHSMWSHRRNGRWKGYVRLDLAPTHDQVARANLNAMAEEGGVT